MSHENDLHAAVVAKHLRDGAGVQVDVRPANAIAGRRGSTFYSTPELASDMRSRIDIEQYQLIWARRIRMPQKGTNELDEEGRAFVDAECRAAFEGMCLTSTSQIIVNPIESERRAESKLWQLHTAESLGFEVPQTLCSNDPDDIRAAVYRLNGSAVLKKLRGTHHRTPLTLEASEAILDDARSLLAAPMLVQERVEAACHYRVHVFLDRVMAFRIVSGALDWRPSAGRGATVASLDAEIERLCLRFCAAAGLYYCILDLIEDRSGRTFFLECNPQGQFLFMEQRTGAPISAAFATLLLVLLGIGERSNRLSGALPA